MKWYDKLLQFLLRTKLGHLTMILCLLVGSALFGGCFLTDRIASCIFNTRACAVCEMCQICANTSLCAGEAIDVGGYAAYDCFCINLCNSKTLPEDCKLFTCLFTNIRPSDEEPEEQPAETGAADPRETVSATDAAAEEESSSEALEEFPEETRAFTFGTVQTAVGETSPFAWDGRGIFGALMRDEMPALLPGKEN